MKATLGWIAALLCLAPGMASAGPFGVIDKMRLERANEALDGELHDYTANNGEDRRIQSNALGEKRDMYVYVPPGFRRDRAYPFIIYLHGLNQDEQSFLEVAPLFDEGIRKGILPPCVIAAPDGTINGDPALFGSGSFYINSEAGRFEDWIMKDVWCFCFNRYPLRRERCCHGLVGASMGGFGVYNLAIKYRHDVSIVAGILPALNLRYVNCHGNAQANYNPDCYGLLSSLRPGQPIACLGGILPIHRRALVKPLFPIEPETLEKLAKESPIEMLDRYGVQPGELRMFIGYAGRDDFNLDAHAESFIDAAKRRNLHVEVVSEPLGRHRVRVGMKMGPEMVQFMGRGLKAGCGCCRCGTCRPAETIEVVEPSEDYETTPDASASPAIDADPAPAVEGQSARRSAAQEEAVEVLWVDSDGASISPRKN